VLTIRQEPRLQFQLQDILAVMVGYGMAAMLFRAFWPESPPSAAVGVPAIGLYLWLGLAMSGPILLWRRRSRSSGDTLQNPQPPVHARSHTWAELAWSLIGAYWIVVGIFVIPARLQDFKPGDMLYFGLLPIAVALALRLFGAGAIAERKVKQAWTHATAVVLVATWPIAWICLIVLGRTMR
jgi:hypothetical protein